MADKHEGYSKKGKDADPALEQPQREAFEQQGRIAGNKSVHGANKSHRPYLRASAPKYPNQAKLKTDSCWRNA